MMSLAWGKIEPSLMRWLVTNITSYIPHYLNIKYPIMQLPKQLSKSKYQKHLQTQLY